MGLPEKKVCVVINKFIHIKLQLPAIFNNHFVIIDPTANLIAIATKIGFQTSIVLIKTGCFVVVLSL